MKDCLPLCLEFQIKSEQVQTFPEPTDEPCEIQGVFSHPPKTPPCPWTAVNRIFTQEAKERSHADVSSVLVYPLNQTKKTTGKSEHMLLLPEGEAESHQ